MRKPLRTSTWAGQICPEVGIRATLALLPCEPRAGSELFGCSDVTAGTYEPNVADGFWIMLKPLKKGDHTIHLGGEIPYFGFSTDVSYHITVD